MNLFSLVAFCRDTRLVAKVGGFADARGAAATTAAAASAAAAAVSVAPAPAEAACGDGDGGMCEEIDASGASGSVPSSSPHLSSTGALHSLLSFLGGLTSLEATGRVLLTRGSVPPPPRPGCCAPQPRNSQYTPGRLKFFLLDPSSRFGAIAESARAVVLAGGTLGPAEALRDALFPLVPAHRLRALSLPHIVDPSHLIAIPLGVGPSGAPLRFGWAHRRSDSSLDELGRLIACVARVTPSGLVVFLPSFDHAAKCVARWGATSVLASLNATKPLFVEPRESSSLESVLSSYARAARSPTGAILLCVVGGKLSEGINFSDDLGRCVLLVGLPYAPPSKPELAARMEWAEARRPGRGRDLYEAMCARAVDQAVGRSIRHAHDYAAIVLADERWVTAGAAAPGAGGAAGAGSCSGGSASPGPIARLPAWMAPSLVPARSVRSFGDAVGRIARFFKERGAAAAAGVGKG